MRYPLIRPVLPPVRQLLPLFEESVRSRVITKGPRVRDFEAAAADYLGVRHAIAMSSATVALALTLRIIREAFRSIWMPSFTFMATGGAAVWAGLDIRFADVLEKDGNLDPASFNADRESALLAVHNYGNPANSRELTCIASSVDVPLLFDAAHAFGARIDGSPVGGQGLASVFSLSPTKILIAGEGGLVSTNDTGLADSLIALREYGNSGNYSIDAIPGLNARMSEMHAAIATLALQTVDDHVKVRNEVAQYYASRFSNIERVRVPSVSPENLPTFKDYTLFVSPTHRNDLARFLATREIGTRSYWNPPLHFQPGFAAAAYRASLPVTELLSASCISIPIWSDMEPHEAGFIADTVEAYFSQPNLR